MSHYDHFFCRPRRFRATRFVLLGTPLLLGLVELGHPVLDAQYPVAMLKPILVGWIIIHLLLMPLFALTGWSMFLLLEGVSGRVATLARGAACVYSVLAIGYESVVGLGSGVVTYACSGFSQPEQRIVERVLSRVILSPLFDRLAVVISVAGGLSILCAIVVLWRSNAPRWVLVVLAGSFCFALAHESPFGPMGNFFFLAGGLFLEILWSPAPPARGAAVPMKGVPVSP